MLVRHGKSSTKLWFGISVSFGCRSLVVRPNFKMAVQYLSCETLVYERRYDLPSGVDGKVVQYEKSGGFVRFLFRDRNDKRRAVLNCWDVPDVARSMEFLRMDFGFGDNVEHLIGAPVYYDGKGNLLKIGNR